MSTSPLADRPEQASGAVPAARLPRRLTLAPPTPARVWLDELEAVFGRFDDQHETAAALAAASARARTLEAAGEEVETARTAALAFAADALTALALDRSVEPRALRAAALRVARILGGPVHAISLELFVRSVSNPRLLELPPMHAIGVQLRLLLELAPFSQVSLWMDGTTGQLECLAQAGEPASSHTVQETARSILDGIPAGAGADPTPVTGVPILRWQQPQAALLGRSGLGGPRRRAFLEQGALRLGPMIEREMLLERSMQRERTLTEAAERKLMRLGFDLHDGPLQDLAALGMDLQLARKELGERVGGRARALVSGRLDDLSAQLEALESSLRELSRSLEPIAIVERPLRNVLRHEVQKFEARGSIRAMLELGGRLDGLTASQRITLYRIVQEGLSNVRDHSEATSVQITVDGRPDRIEAQVVDNGKGFHVETTLRRARTNGRLGLIGLGERVRLLGGRFDIRSREGGPTTLSVTLPRWRPPRDQEPGRSESAPDLSMDPGTAARTCPSWRAGTPGWCPASSI